MKFRFLTIISCILIFAACKQTNSKHLYGNWVATKILEAKEDMKLDPNEIQFTFDKNGHYSYKSTIGYKEEGVYSIEGDLLLSKDTTSASSKQKAVKILQLQKDSLTLEMLANGKEQIVYLVKK